MSRTYGSYMIQPTKDQIRSWLRETRHELKEELTRRRIAEHKLAIATRKLGALVLEGKINVPIERLGELVIQTANEEEVAAETQRVLAEV
jgi:hypothetical protein